MKAFWLSLGVAFWSEMGDKTQILALAYATRYRLRDVLLGILWGTAVVHLVSVAAGRFIASWLPAGIVLALSAACFLGFGIWTLRGDKHDGRLRESSHHPILFIGGAFFLTELGDKTMLTAMTLATTWDWMPVWLGTTAGMVVSDVIAVGVGRTLGKKIPEKSMRWVAAALFFGFAAWSAWQAWRSF
jgi:putative Ca2+/H+ antiporter (TMEM165/GDT1 family)